MTETAVMLPTAERPARIRPTRRWTPVALLAVAFMAGGGVGSGATVLYFNWRMQHFFADPRGMQQRVLSELQAKLELTDEQVSKIDAIMKERWAAMDAIRAEAAPRFEKEFKEMNSQINDLLSDEQRPKWLEWVENTRKRFPPPPPHGRHSPGDTRPSHDAPPPNDGPPGHPRPDEPHT